MSIEIEVTCGQCGNVLEVEITPNDRYSGRAEFVAHPCKRCIKAAIEAAADLVVSRIFCERM